MPKFRKKPIVIDAVQWDGSISSAQEVIRWSRDIIAYASESRGDPDEAKRYKHDWLVVPTLEGCVYAQPGDWIIRGVADELYPCKPGIFAQTYEPAE